MKKNLEDHGGAGEQEQVAGDRVQEDRHQGQHASLQGDRPDARPQPVAAEDEEVQQDDQE